MDITSVCAALAQQASMATEYALIVASIAFVIACLSILYRSQVFEKLRVDAKKKGLRVDDDFFATSLWRSFGDKPTSSVSMRSPKTDDQGVRPSRLNRTQ